MKQKKQFFFGNRMSILLALVLLLSSTQIFADILSDSPQTITSGQKQVSGKVTDKSGAAIPGVNIVEKGTTNGVITNANGAFLIAISSPGATLVVSFIGYTSLEIKPGAKNELSIVLLEDVVNLEDVVVIGYGTQRKRDLTGSVATIAGEVFKERKQTQLSQALQGAVAGLSVTRSGSNGAMGGATLRIRGVTTIGTSDPLVIVDGVPVTDMNAVNANDIESLTVLKDAASASIYGSRAASGVILITTQRAKTDQTTLQYTFESGVDKATQIPKYANATQYMNHINEMYWNDNGNGANQYPQYTKAAIDGYMTNNATDPDKYPNTDMIALTLKPSQPRQSHTLSFSSGTKSVRSNASLKYEKVGGFYDNKDYDRIFARTNNDFVINKFIGASLDLNFSRTHNTDPAYLNGGDPLGAITLFPGVYPAVWKDGRVADGKAGNNPYGSLKYNGTSQQWNNVLGGKVSLDIKPLSGLKLTGVLAPIFNFNQSKFFNKRVDAYSATDPAQFVTTLTDAGSGGKTTKLIEGRGNNYSITAQFLLNYDKNFGDHNFSFLLGNENYYYKNESVSASRDLYQFTNYPYLDQGPRTVIDNTGSAYETAYESYFGRISYSFKGRYLLQANVRKDGSSRFKSEYRWGTFPSISAGWVLSEETFMKNQHIFDYLKLRASWGSLGNERIGNYPYLGVISFSTAQFYQNGTATAQQAAAQVQYAIPDISWEKTETSGIGLDASFLNKRLRFTGDAYFKQTKDMLLPLQIPIYIGFANPNQNTGIMTTKGMDLDLGWNDKIGKLNYSVSVNLSQYKSLMGDLGGTEFLGDQIKKKGSEFNEWYGYLAQGIYQTQADVTGSPTINSNIKAGDRKYLDISGPNGVPDGKISPDYDRVLLGSSQPQWIYGGNLKFDYKGWDLSLAFQGIGKQNQRIVGTDYFAASFGNFASNMDGKYFSVFNTPEQNQAAIYPRFTVTNRGSNDAMSNDQLFNGGYFRLKNISLGYNLPMQKVSNNLIKNIRIYASALDLFSISKYPKGYDPEGLGIVTTIFGGINLTF